MLPSGSLMTTFARSKASILAFLTAVQVLPIWGSGPGGPLPAAVAGTSAVRINGWLRTRRDQDP